jgi:hypothetical protein
MQSTAKVMQIKSNAEMQVLQKMQSIDLMKIENNEDNAKVTAYMNAIIIIPSNP